MSTLTVNVDDAQNQLRALLTMALQGDEVIIADDDKPITRLVPVAPAVATEHAPKKKRIAGLNRGAAVWMSEDFDDPLPAELWLEKKS